MNYGYIYKTTDLENQKVYIGKRKGVFNPNYFGSGLIIKRSIKKNGTGKFKVEIITYLHTQEQLSEFEKFVIEKYREILGRDRLYNISDGGEGVSINKGQKKPHPISCRCPFCQAKQGLRKGVNCPNFGKRIPLKDSWKNRFPPCVDCGKMVSSNKTKRCLKCYTLFKVGKNNPNWRGKR